jgi:carboxypeptidase PM20D1
MPGPVKAWYINDGSIRPRKPVPPPPSRTRKLLRRIKELAQLAFIVALALAAALVVNTLRQRPRPLLTVPPPPADAVDVGAVAKHLSLAIRFRTVSHENRAEDDTTELLGLRRLLESTYPRVHATLSREIINGSGLLYTWKGTDDSLRPALFAAHMDVVPVEPGPDKAWSHPPFEGAIDGGFVWGRGALDDKGSLICLLEAAELLIGQGFKPKRTVYFAFGFDEEVGGTEGAKRIALLLKDRGLFLEYVLDEGMAVTEGVFPDVAVPVAAIGTAEKGFVTVELSAEVEGGHSSMPPRATAIGLVASAVSQVERNPMPARLDAATRQGIELLAGTMPFPKRVVASNLWITEPLIALLAARQPTLNALVRTTTAPTVFEAGVKDNVLPTKARALINSRVLPGDTVDGVLAHTRAAVTDGRVRVTKLERLISEPSMVSSSESRAFRLIEKTARQFFPNAVVVPALVVGATDSRHYALSAENVYRFVPIKLRAEDLKRVHGADERAGIEDLGTAVRAYEQVLRDGP